MPQPSALPRDPVDGPWLSPGDAPSASCHDLQNCCMQYPEVAVVLGHSGRGHRLLKALVREYGYPGGRGVTPALLTELTDAELLDMRLIGGGTIAWFRDRMRRLDMPQRGGLTGLMPVWLPESTWRTLARLLEAPGGTPSVVATLRTARTEIVKQTSRGG